MSVLSSFLSGLKKFVAQFFLLISMLIIVPIAVANRHETYLSLDPFSAQMPLLSFKAPMFIWLMVALILGVMLGSVVGWLDGRKTRQELKRTKKQMAKLQKENDQYKLDKSETMIDQEPMALLTYDQHS